MAKYCIECGHKLKQRIIDGENRLACSNCDYVHWGSFSIGVGALVLRNDKVLLIRRAHHPGKGVWTNPGGYCEQRETIDVSVEREVLEETGVSAKVIDIRAIRDQSRDTHNLYVAFAMEYVSGEPVADELEVDAAGFFSLEEMAQMNVASLTKWLVDVALTSTGNAMHVDDVDLGYSGTHKLFRVPRNFELDH